MVLAFILFSGCQKAANPQSKDTGSDNTASENRKFTLEMYLQIQMNSTYDEVQQILGDPGVAFVEGDVIKQYMWENDDKSNIGVTFNQLKVTGKSQAFLGPYLKGDKKVTQAQFNKIKEGMKPDEVTAILGQGTEILQTLTDGEEKIMIGWNNSDGGTIGVTFINGEVTDTSSMMLK